MKKPIFICLSLLMIGLWPLSAAAEAAAVAAEEQEYEDVGADALTFLNANRGKKGVARIVVNHKLTEAAGAHALDMAKEEFFSHDGSNGSNVGDRVQKVGYKFCLVAENIAKGQQTLEEVLKGWRDSDGHGRNMLNPDVLEFGMVHGPEDIWVLVLGRSGC